MKRDVRSNFLKEYDYKLPRELIASEPARPRDSARLLVYNRSKDEVSLDTFQNLTKYLPKKSVLVFNETKVLPARLRVKKETGGEVRLLCLGEYAGCVRVLSDRKLVIGQKLYVTPKIFFKVQGKDGAHFFLLPSFAIEKLREVLERYGIMPLPPYIKETPLKEHELRAEYQAVFAKNEGSIAAPTASLHFTNELLAQLKKSGQDQRFVTLHVGLGTFSSLTPENIKTKSLHEERYKIDERTANFLNRAKQKKRPIIAVGTTVMRTLESASNARSVLTKLEGSTDLFIQEGYNFKYVDGLITNFHVPRSSLLMLVSALVGRKKVMRLYKQAIAEKFRFFSFGDGMLIL